MRCRIYELPKRVYKFTFFQAKRRRCLSSSSIFGAGSLYVVPSTIIQMVSRVFKSHAFAGRSYFGTKFANSFDTMPAWSVHRLFPLQGFPTSFGHISPYRCARNFNFVKLKSFCLVELLRIYVQLFPITFLTQFVTKTGYLPDLLLGLSSEVFTFDHLFTHPSDFFNNLPISLTEWSEYRSNKMTELKHKQFRLHFRERVEKIKENGKNTKIENLQNRQEKYGGKKLAYVHFWGKNEKIWHFLQILVWTTALNGCVDKCRTWISLHLPKEALMEYVWKSSLWIGIFQRATQRPRILLTDNIQNGGSCSVDYN